VNLGLPGTSALSDDAVGTRCAEHRRGTMRVEGGMARGRWHDAEGRAPHAMMKRTIGQDGSQQFVPSDVSQRAHSRCAICHRRLDHAVAYLDETGDVPEPRQSWMLCPACNAAVHVEMERSPVQGPLRVRIAVGLVAAERSPDAVRRVRTGFHDDAWLPLLFWGFGIVMVLHLIVIALIAMH
jgi:hypothetical protein